MIKETIANAPHNRQVQRVTDNCGQVTYMVKQGSKYIGKVSDGGYKTAQSALNRAYSV